MGLLDAFDRMVKVAEPAENARDEELRRAKSYIEKEKGFGSADDHALIAIPVLASMARLLATTAREDASLSALYERYADDLSSADPAKFPIPITMAKFWSLLDERLYDHYLATSRTNATRHAA